MTPKRTIEVFSAGCPTCDEIADLVRVFFADGTNEARFRDRLEQHVNRVVELGFLRKLRGRDDAYEVRRILKAFVDAQWLGELERRLADYREHGAGAAGEEEVA